MKYSPEKKSEALARIAEIGVQATSKELNISTQTLYKWQHEQEEQIHQPTEAKPQLNVAEICQWLENDKTLEVALGRLEEENSALRAQNTQLLQTVLQLKKALTAMLS